MTKIRFGPINTLEDKSLQPGEGLWTSEIARAFKRRAGDWNTLTCGADEVCDFESQLMVVVPKEMPTGEVPKIAIKRPSQVAAPESARYLRELLGFSGSSQRAAIWTQLVKDLSEAVRTLAESAQRPNVATSGTEMASISVMTEKLFGVPALFQEKIGEIGEDDYILVKVNVGQSADPREMATRHSVWHGQLTDLKVSDPNVFRLQVTYA